MRLNRWEKSTAEDKLNTRLNLIINRKFTGSINRTITDEEQVVQVVGS